MAYSNVGFQNPYYQYSGTLAGGGAPSMSQHPFQAQMAYGCPAGAQMPGAIFNPAVYANPGSYYQVGEYNYFGGNPMGYTVAGINPGAMLSDPGVFNPSTDNAGTGGRSSAVSSSKSSTCTSASCKSCDQTQGRKKHSAVNSCDVDGCSSMDCMQGSSTLERKSATDNKSTEARNSAEKSPPCSFGARNSNSCNCSERSAAACRCSGHNCTSCGRCGARTVPVTYVNADRYNCYARAQTANDLAVCNRTCDGYSYCTGPPRQNCNSCQTKSTTCCSSSTNTAGPVATNASTCGTAVSAGAASTWCPLATNARAPCSIPSGTQSFCPIDSNQTAYAAACNAQPCGAAAAAANQYYQYPCASATSAVTQCGPCPLPSTDNSGHQVMSPQCALYGPASYNMNRYGPAANYARAINAYVCTPNSMPALPYNPGTVAYAVPAVAATAEAARATATGGAPPTCDGTGSEGLDPDTATDLSVSEPKTKCVVS